VAPRLLIAFALFFVAVAPARADLVELNWAHAHRGAQLARAAGGTELAHELRIWRVPSYAVTDLRRAGVVRVSEPDRLFQTLAAAQLQATDPLVPLQWWRAAIGSDQVESPGAGKPVTVVDSGVDLTHPEFATRPNTTALNAQTTTEVDEDHGTEVSSVIDFRGANNDLPVIATRLADRRAADAPLERATELKSVLEECIARLKPNTDDEFGTSEEWRYYNALYFYYVRGIRPYSVRTNRADLDPVCRRALSWFADQVPQRTLHNGQTTAARIIARELRSGIGESVH